MVLPINSSRNCENVPNLKADNDDVKSAEKFLEAIKASNQPSLFAPLTKAVTYLTGSNTITNAVRRVVPFLLPEVKNEGMLSERAVKHLVLETFEDKDLSELVFEAIPMSQKDIYSAEYKFLKAKVRVLEDPFKMHEYIYNYRGYSEDYRFEIAKVAATAGGHGVSQVITMLNLSDDHRYEIAKLAATSEPREPVSKHIEKYGIEDKDKLFEIAKIAAAHTGESVSKNIQNYGIEDEDKLFEIAKIAAVQDFNGVSKNIQNYGIKDEQKLFEIFVICSLLEGKIVENSSDFRITEKIEGVSEIVNYPLFKKIGLNKELVKKIFILQNPLARKALMRIVSTEKIDLENSANPLDVPKTIFNLSVNTKVFKDSLKVQQLIVTTNDLLLSTLNKGMAKKVLQLAVKGGLGQSSDIRKAMQLISTLISLERTESLKDVECRADIDSKFDAAFSEILDVHDISDLSDKYSKTFGLYRNPSALMVYLGRLNTLQVQEKKALIGNVQTFVREVLEGNFERNRYAADTPEFWKSNKVRKVEIEFNDDVKGWLTSYSQVDRGMKSYSLVFTDDPCDLLLMGTDVPGSCQRVEGDPNLNKGLIGTVLSEDKLVALKDASGRIISRALMRRSKEGDIFIEKVYPQVCSETQRRALIEMAQEVAKEGGVSLYTTELGGSGEKKTLFFTKGRGYCKYVDAAGGNQLRDFNITGARLVI